MPGPMTLRSSSMAGGASSVGEGRGLERAAGRVEGSGGAAGGRDGGSVLAQEASSSPVRTISKRTG